MEKKIKLKLWPSYISNTTFILSQMVIICGKNTLQHASKSEVHHCI